MQKRIFLLNIIMMLLSMILLFMVTTTFVNYAVNRFTNSEQWIADYDQDAQTVLDIIEQSEDANWASLEEQIVDYQYTLIVQKDDAIIYPEGMSEQENNMVQKVESRETRGLHAILSLNFVDADLTIDGQTYYVAAIHEENVESREQINESSSFLYEVIVVGVLTIFFLCFVGWFFAKRQVNRITRPLQQLIEKLRLAGEGDHSVLMEDSGEIEFKLACEAFNNMQIEISRHEREKQEQEERRIDMITSISHDLRTPLTSIKGYIKAILDGVANTKEKENTYLRIAYDTTGEMDQLLQKLFLFSKIETGRMPFDKVKLSMREYLYQYMEKRKQQYQEDEMIFSLSCEGDDYEGYYDVLQMQRVFDNLLENSIRYSGRRPVQVTISLLETDKEEIIGFHDNGEGVPQEKIEKIFERFYRCDAARSQEGNGVGLYIVKYIVEAQDGYVEAISEDGFTIKMHFPKNK